MTPKQFQKFYETHIDKVYRFIFFRVGQNVQIAEDLTSEVFLSAVQNVKKLDTGQSPTAWIMTVARNRLKNHYRDTKQHADVDDLAPFLEGEDGRDTANRQEGSRHLYEALKKLKPTDRKLVELKHLHGFSFKEIADMLGKTPGAVRVQSHRALKSLKAILTAYE